MKRFVFILLVLAAVFWFYGDPGGLLGRVSMWACEWMHNGKAC